MANIELTETKEWKALERHYQKIKDTHLNDLFDRDPNRFEKFSLYFDDMLVDFSKNRITEETLELLVKLAEAAEVATLREALFRGEKVNWTEQWAALHVALRNRSNEPIFYEDRDVMPDVNAMLSKMKHFSDAIRSGSFTGYTGKKIRTVIHIGIGGSFLGPLMITEALKPYAVGGPTVRFIPNVDGSDFFSKTQDLNPEETLFIVASKTFTTQETMTNAQSAKSWILNALKDKKAVKCHFVAVSTNMPAIEAFGIDPENVFEFWDWVGGRYSWASTIGLSIACNIGYNNFVQILEGAHAMDMHFKETPFDKNIPALLGLIGIWYNNFFGAETVAILPYYQYLEYLPVHMQQLDMESNGKYVDKDGNVVTYQTGPIIWGNTGTNGQHAFFQLLHQGTKLIPADFIGCVKPYDAIGDHHEKLMANFFAQTEALMRGNTADAVMTELTQKGVKREEIKKLLPHKVFPGNRPTNTILVKEFTPKAIGILLSLYEMKVFTQGAIWRINSFDQWGVELGKVLSRTILSEEMSLLAGEQVDLSQHDSSTRGLIEHFVTNFKL